MVDDHPADHPHRLRQLGGDLLHPLHPGEGRGELRLRHERLQPGHPLGERVQLGQAHLGRWLQLGLERRQRLDLGELLFDLRLGRLLWQGLLRRGLGARLQGLLQRHPGHLLRRAELTIVVAADGVLDRGGGGGGELHAHAQRLLHLLRVLPVGGVGRGDAQDPLRRIAVDGDDAVPLADLHGHGLQELRAHLHRLGVDERDAQLVREHAQEQALGDDATVDQDAADVPAELPLVLVRGGELLLAHGAVPEEEVFQLEALLGDLTHSVNPQPSMLRHNRRRGEKTTGRRSGTAAAVTYRPGPARRRARRTPACP